MMQTAGHTATLGDTHSHPPKLRASSHRLHTKGLENDFNSVAQGAAGIKHVLPLPLG